MLLDTLTRAKAAAILTCLGCSRDEIAEQLHVSLASVFRSLRLARELGMIGPPIPVLKLPVEEFDETCPYIVDPDASRALTKRLANLGVERVRVVPASPDPRINTRRVAKACSLLLRLAITRFCRAAPRDRSHLGPHAPRDDRLDAPAADLDAGTHPGPGDR